MEKLEPFLIYSYSLFYLISGALLIFTDLNYLNSTIDILIHQHFLDFNSEYLNENTMTYVRGIYISLIGVILIIPNIKVFGLLLALTNAIILFQNLEFNFSIYYVNCVVFNLFISTFLIVLFNNKTIKTYNL